MSLDATLDRFDVVLLRLARSRAARMRQKEMRKTPAAPSAPEVRKSRGNRGLGRRHRQLVEVRIAMVRAAKRALEAAEKAPFLETKELDRIFGIGG